jgi:hypothetical protein
MKTPASVLASLSLAAALSAQGSLSTATGYADFANAGNGHVSGVPAGTEIGPRGLQIRVADGRTPAGTVPAALASTDVQLGAPTTVTALAVHVTERGSALASRGGRAAAGTSDDPRQGTPGAHGLTWLIPAREGARAKVVVHWSGSASANSATAATVYVDGNGRPDFAAGVRGGRDARRAEFDVVAGPRGFRIGISTSGHAAAGGPSVSAAGEIYDADLNVALRPEGSGGPTCNFRPFGPECGGKLAGRAHVASSAGAIGVALHLSGAAPQAIAALVLGDPLPSPVQLPGSRCSLLVNPRGVAPGQTGRNGEATWSFAFRPPAGVSLTVAFQAITLSLSGGGASLASSNGLAMDCR